MTKRKVGNGRLAALLQPGAALIAASVLLPAVLFVSAAWFSYGEILRESEARVDRTARLLEEHALKVFETDRLVIDQINGRLRFMDWSREADRADLHRLVVKLQNELDQVLTINVVDADGHLRAGGRGYPSDTTLSFADRDWFQALKASDQSLPYVSRSYAGRQSGAPIFNFAARVTPNADGAFAGAIAVAADRGYFEKFYRDVEPTVNHSVLLVRNDGYILAAEPKIGIDRLSETSALRSQIKSSPTGNYTMLSRIDGIERIFAYRKIGPYPLFVRFGLDRAAALAPWRATLMNYGFVAALASSMLIAASWLAVRQTARERVARQRWQDTAAALEQAAVERERIEQQLRQSQKMEAVGRLTGGVAHDFNNLLTAVIGSLDLVLRRATTVEPRTVQLVRNALEGANRAAALTARLLAFSRQQPLQPVQLEANDLVAGMSDLLRRTLGETIAIETVLAPDLWATLADPNQLESAILNLAVNARDAMPDGGALTIATRNVDLDAAAAGAIIEATPGRYIVVSVSDTGSGMAPDIVGRIFEPFFTTKPLGKGTGLGLSQVYGFAKQSGGVVAVSSTPGQGSTFGLHLPYAERVAPSATATAAEERACEAPRGTGATILVVEDDEMVRRLSVATLVEAGYRVLEAVEGPPALDLVARHREIALLFTDVGLTGPMNGRVLADKIMETRPDLPVLFTTGYTSDSVIQQGMLGSGVTVLTKPFTSARLLGMVQDMMQDRVA